MKWRLRERERQREMKKGRERYLTLQSASCVAAGKAWSGATTQTGSGPTDLGQKTVGCYDNPETDTVQERWMGGEEGAYE